MREREREERERERRERERECSVCVCVLCSAVVLSLLYSAVLRSRADSLRSHRVYMSEITVS